MSRTIDEIREWNRTSFVINRAEVETLLAEVERLTAERDKYHHTLLVISETDPAPLNEEGDDVCDVCCGLRETANEALETAEAVRG